MSFVKVFLSSFLLAVSFACTPFINELHYDNSGTDTGEAVELAAPDGTDLNNYRILFYNGANGEVYRTETLSGAVTGTTDGWGFVSVTGTVQNGSPDGLALVDQSDNVLEFISYEGTITAVNGAASGQTSVDIGVSENADTPVGFSLQLSGSGCSALDFTWQSPSADSFGSVNSGQSFPSCDCGSSGGGSASINEFHYDNSGADVNEAVEIAATAGTNLMGWTLLFYNGNGGTVYDSISLSGTVSDSGNGYGFVVFTNPGIQNGKDGIALANPSGTIAEFLCYEGTFTATDGPASSQSCSDVGASESGSTPSEFSVQKFGCGDLVSWRVAASSFGSVNDDQVLGSSSCPALPSLRIFDIQGSGLTSPHEGEEVNVPGIVTALASNGFYMQDADGDGDDATSDGIFVFTSSSPSVSVGDKLNLTGTVEEFTPPSSPCSQPLTELTGATWVVESAGNSLPLPKTIAVNKKEPPKASIPKGIDFYESLEGMRVLAADPLVIAPKSRFDEYWTVVNMGAASTVLSPRQALVISKMDFNPERVQIDVNAATLPGFTAPSAQTGDTLSSVTGILSYSFGSYEVIATEPFSVTAGGLLPASTTLSKTSSNLLIATLNTLNLDPSDNTFSEFADIVINKLNSPDIVALQEIQDNDGPTNSQIISASETLQTLVNAISAAGGPLYFWADNVFIGDDTNGGEPGGNIRCAYIYLDSRVQLISVDTVTDQNDQQTNPSNPFYNSRLPLVGNFRSRQTNGEVQLVNVHFSSKGGSAPIFGTKQPFSMLQDDPEVNGSVDDRLEQANAVASYLANSAATNRVILGDCNEFQFNGPVQAMGNGFTIMMNTLPSNMRYSFIFEGNAQALDQVLISDNLVAGSKFESVHCNSELSSQTSDHDPLIVSLEI